MKKGILFRGISLVIIWTFLITSSSFAIDANSGVDSKVAKDKASKQSTLKGVLESSIPSSWGVIREVHNAGSDKLIINVQDAHCDFEAQQNISKILDRFAANYALKLITLEGASGVVGNPILSRFPDKRVIKDVSLYFMKEGKLTGAEHLAANTDYDLKLYGVEDISLYMENLAAFEQSEPFKKEVKQYFAILKEALDKIREYIYNIKLKQFDELKDNYSNKKISFSEYTVSLFKLVKENNLDDLAYPTFSELQKAIGLEKQVDFQRADAERNQLITALTEVTSDKKDIIELIDKSLNYKKGILSAAAYGAFLKDLAYKMRLNLAEYVNFDNYVKYITKYEEVAKESLFKEIKKIEFDIKDALYTHYDQKTLDNLYAYLEALDKLVDLKMRTEDIAYFFRNRTQINIDTFIQFIESQKVVFNLDISLPAELSYIDVYLPAWAKFYELADKRDLAFIENTLRQMDKEDVKFAALITGGFHTEKLTQLMKAMNISYLVITPRASASDDNPYLSIMRGEKTRLEEFVKQLQSTLVPFISASFEAISSLPDEQRNSLKTLEIEEQLSLLVLEAVVEAGVLAKESPEMEVQEIKNAVTSKFNNMIRILPNIGTEDGTVTITADQINAIITNTLSQIDIKRGTEAENAQVLVFLDMDEQNVLVYDSYAKESDGLISIISQAKKNAMVVDISTPSPTDSTTISVETIKDPGAVIVESRKMLLDGMLSEVSQGATDNMSRLKAAMVMVKVMENDLLTMDSERIAIISEELQVENPLFIKGDRAEAPTLINRAVNVLNNTKNSMLLKAGVDNAGESVLTDVVGKKLNIAKPRQLVRAIILAINNLVGSGKNVSENKKDVGNIVKHVVEASNITGVAELETFDVERAVDIILTEAGVTGVTGVDDKMALLAAVKNGNRLKAIIMQEQEKIMATRLNCHDLKSYTENNATLQGGQRVRFEGSNIPDKIQKVAQTIGIKVDKNVSVSMLPGDYSNYSENVDVKIIASGKNSISIEISPQDESLNEQVILEPLPASLLMTQSMNIMAGGIGLASANVLRQKRFDDLKEKISKIRSLVGVERSSDIKERDFIVFPAQMLGEIIEQNGPKTKVIMKGMVSEEMLKVALQQNEIAITFDKDMKVNPISFIRQVERKLGVSLLDKVTIIDPYHVGAVEGKGLNTAGDINSASVTAVLEKRSDNSLRSIHHIIPNTEREISQVKVLQERRKDIDITYSAYDFTLVKGEQLWNMNVVLAEALNTMIKGNSKDAKLTTEQKKSFAGFIKAIFGETSPLIINLSDGEIVASMDKQLQSIGNTRITDLDKDQLTIYVATELFA